MTRVAAAVLLLALLGVAGCGDEQQAAQERTGDDRRIRVRDLRVHEPRPSNNTRIRLVETGEASYRTEAGPSDPERPRWTEQRYFGSWTEKEGRHVLLFDWHETWVKTAVEDDFEMKAAHTLDPALGLVLERGADGLYGTVRSDMPRGEVLWTRTRGQGFWTVVREEFDTRQRVKDWMRRTRMPESGR